MASTSQQHPLGELGTGWSGAPEVDAGDLLGGHGEPGACLIEPVTSRLLLQFFAATWTLALVITVVSRFCRKEKSTARGASTCLVTMTLLISLSALLVGIACPQSILAATSSLTFATQSTASSQSEFTVPASADEGQNLIPNILDPEAVDAQTVCPGYIASNVQTTSVGLTADLNLAGPACNVYGTDIDNLTLTVEYQAPDRVHVGIQPRYVSPENETWFLLPETLIPKPSFEEKDASKATNDLEVSWTNDPTFAFSVTRKSTSDVLFSTNGSKLVYENQFIEFVSSLPENYNLYGLGEVIHGFRLGNNLTRTIFAADVGDPIDENIYGSHPIYLDTRYFGNNGTAGEPVYIANATDTSAEYKSYTHGVFLRNTHAQEILLRAENITWRTLGGSVDLYFYSGTSAEQVITSYQTSTVGLPALQQYWTFGFHQCRWGYQNWSVVEDVVDNFAKANIPLETMWTDIDYMNQYRDFENDQERFGYVEGAQFLAKLHANGQHYVPIVDSAIYHPNPEEPEDAYPTYDRGVAVNAFMLNPDGSLYIGEVWPGYTVYPDWVGAVLNTSGTFGWWATELAIWYKNVSFDGIWIDMSEVSSFCVGSCGSQNLSMNPVHPSFLLPGEPGNLVLGYPEGFNLTNATEAASASAASVAQAAATTATSTSTQPYLRTTPTPGVRNINWPPYVINNVQGDLAVHAVSPNATHHGGAVEYDFHNLFGHQILNATYHALLGVFPSKRPFVIGRSTFAGSGKWAGHWGGDNASLWAYMVFSISQALSFSVFGIPMFGVDTCGFADNSDMELCSRWMQLSAFFPFYRNHNSLAGIPQEPYVWAEVAEASRTAIAIRYAMLPYLYTLFAYANAGGSTVMRALAWEFPGEPWLADADRQFLLGPAVLVTPCLVQGAETVDGVFPGVGDGKTVWYDWYNQSAITDVGRGQNVTLEAPLGHIPLFVRGGYVLPIQAPGMTIKECRQNPWAVIAALDARGAASGTLYLDDGESLAPSDRTWVEFFASNTSVSAQPKGNYTDTNPLANVTVLGVPGNISNATLNGKPATLYASWNATTKALSFTGLGNLTSRGAWNQTWHLTWDLA